MLDERRVPAVRYCLIVLPRLTRAFHFERDVLLLTNWISENASDSRLVSRIISSDPRFFPLFFGVYRMNSSW